MRRRASAPVTPRPASSMAQAPGSGTAGSGATLAVTKPPPLTSPKASMSSELKRPRICTLPEFVVLPGLQQLS